MRKRKPKMLNHRIGKVKKLQSVFTHQGVHNEERNFTVVHFFDDAKFV